MYILYTGYEKGQRIAGLILGLFLDDKIKILLTSLSISLGP